MKSYNAHTHKIPENQAGIFQSDGNYTESLFSVGVHPWDSDVKSADELISAMSHPNCRAIGEIGLDRLQGPSIEIQRAMLLDQLRLAKEHKKPVLFHIVKAWDEFYSLVKSQQQTPWIIHGFNTPKQFPRLVQTKVIFSLGPSSIQNPHMQPLLHQIPLNRLLFETDDSTIDINQVYLDFSLATSTPLEAIYAQIEQNFLAIFGA